MHFIWVVLIVIFGIAAIQVGISAFRRLQMIKSGFCDDHKYHVAFLIPDDWKLKSFKRTNHCLLKCHPKDKRSEFYITPRIGIFFEMEKVDPIGTIIRNSSESYKFWFDKKPLKVERYEYKKSNYFSNHYNFIEECYKFIFDDTTIMYAIEINFIKQHTRDINDTWIRIIFSTPNLDADYEDFDYFLEGIKFYEGFSYMQAMMKARENWEKTKG